MLNGMKYEPFSVECKSLNRPLGVLLEHIYQTNSCVIKQTSLQKQQWQTNTKSNNKTTKQKLNNKKSLVPQSVCTFTVKTLDRIVVLNILYLIKGYWIIA